VGAFPLGDRGRGFGHRLDAWRVGAEDRAAPDASVVEGVTGEIVLQVVDLRTPSFSDDADPLNEENGGAVARAGVREARPARLDDRHQLPVNAALRFPRNAVMPSLQSALPKSHPNRWSAGAVAACPLARPRHRAPGPRGVWYPLDPRPPDTATMTRRLTPFPPPTLAAWAAVVTTAAAYWPLSVAVGLAAVALAARRGVAGRVLTAGAVILTPLCLSLLVLHGLFFPEGQTVLAQWGPASKKCWGRAGSRIGFRGRGVSI